MKFIFFILLSSINLIYSIKKVTLPFKIASYLVSHDRKNIWVGTHSGQLLKVDPKTNNLQCFDQNTFLSCNTSGKIIEFKNSISTLIQSPNSLNFVLACGNRYFASDFGYRCTLHDKNNIMLFEKLPNQNNENIFSSNHTSMLFYSNAPNGLNLTEDMVVFVAKSLRSESYKQNLEQSIFLSSRKEVSDYDKKKTPKTNSFLESLVHSSFPQLSRSQGLKLNYTCTYNDGYSFTAMGLAPNYVPKVDIKFIYGFSHERFSYALYMQKSVSDNQGSHIYQTRLIRICQDDLSFSSYTEVPLTCYFGSHHVPYNLAKTAFFGKDSHGSHVLHIAMNTNYPNVESSEANLSLGTVLCMFPMSEIMAAFTQAIKDCYNGYGFHIPWLVGIQEQCVKDTSAQINDSFCGSPSNYPIQAQNELFVQTPYHIKGLSVSSLSIQNNHDKAINKMIGFIGTTNGLIIKFVLDQDEITFVWAYDTVTSTQIPNPNHLNHQTLTHQNLMQTVQNDDSFILPLPLTPAILPMTQHSFVEQNQDYYFASEKTPSKISMLVLASNKQLLLIPTNSCSIYGTSCQQCIQSHVLDPLECGWCTTSTQNTINTEKGQCMTQNECKNRGHIHDAKFNTIGTNRFDKHIGIAQSSESIYHWETQNCKPIIKKVWPLNGPIQGGTEIYIYGDYFQTSFDSYQNSKDKNVETLNVYLSPTMAQSTINNIEMDWEICQISFMNDTIIKCKVPPLFKLQTKFGPSNNNNDVNLVTKFYITLKEEMGQKKSLTKYGTIPFEYKEVQIYEYEPHMGILPGSNIIRLYGNNLDVGSNVTVSVSHNKDKYSCKIVNQTSKLIICHLKLPEKTIGNYIYESFNISLTIDNLITHVIPNFKVIPVPNLITLTPTKCIMSGGCALTLSINDIQSTDMATWLKWQNLLNISLIVYKNDVELLFGPLNEFHSIDDNEIHILINTNGSFCKKQDNTHSLLCTIVIPNITSHLINFMAAKSLTSKSTAGFLLKNGYLVTVSTSSVSLIMAKISVYFNQIIPIFVQSFVLYRDPVYYSFPLTPYRLNGTTNELTIRGERLDLVHTPQNIKILVGKQYVCVIHKFNSNYLTCHIIHINHLANQSFAESRILVTNLTKLNVETKELPYGKLKQNDLSVYVGTHFLEHNMQNGQNINDGRRVKRDALQQTKKEIAHEVLVMAGPLTFSLGMVWFDPAHINGYYQRNEKDTLSKELHTADISDNSSLDVRANFVWAILAVSILACFIVCFLVCAWWKRYKNMKLKEALRLTPKYMQSFPYISSTAQNNKLNNRFPWLSECDNNNTCSSSSVTTINNINNHNIVTCLDSEDSLNTNLDDKSSIKYLPQTLNEFTNQSCMHESTSNKTDSKSSHPARRSKKTTLSSNLRPFVFGKTAAQNYPALLLDSDFIYRQQYSVNNMVSSMNTNNTPSTKSGLLHKISSNFSRRHLIPPKPGVAFGQTNVLECYSDNNDNKKRKSARNGNGPTLPANLLRDFDEETRSLLQDPSMLIPPDRLQIGPLIGQGNFGRVYKGFYFYYPNSSCGTSNMPSVAENSINENVAKQSKNTPVKQDCVDVAIKTLNTTLARPEDLRSFLHEGLRMKEFSHPHVMSLIGISWGGPHNHKAAFAFGGVASDKTSTSTLVNLRSLLFPNKLTDVLRTANNNPYEYLQQPLVILPYMSNGDMLSYLRNPGVNPTLGNLLTWAHQIADGMTYLSKLKFVHRDLAARNCMLNQDYCAVVSDFGLSRDIYEKDYYSCSNKAVRLPIKWMALESLTKNIYNAKTDVWSFGIVLWELMTRGINPYPDVNNWDILTYLSCGRRLLQPLYCPDNLYQLMLSCWMPDPAERPTFESIMEKIQSIIEELASESIKDITYHYDTAYYICNNNNQIHDKHSAESVVSPSNETITNKDNTKLNRGQISSFEMTEERQKRDTVSVWDC